MKGLCWQHIKQSVEGETDTTVMFDGTTKALGHLVEVEVTTKDGPLLVGMTQQCGGTAKGVL